MHSWSCSRFFNCFQCLNFYFFTWKIFVYQIVLCENKEKILCFIYTKLKLSFICNCFNFSLFDLSYWFYLNFNMIWLHIIEMYITLYKLFVFLHIDQKYVFVWYLHIHDVICIFMMWFAYWSAYIDYITSFSCEAFHALPSFEPQSFQNPISHYDTLIYYQCLSYLTINMICLW